MSFLQLKSRYILEGRLKVTESVHIGSGEAGFDTDAAFLHDSKGRFLPGSSLRGVMRTAAERILQGLGGQRGCVLFEVGSHDKCLTAAEPGRQEAARKLPPAKLRRLLWNEGGQCDICKLFGSPWAASRLRIEDGRIAGNHSFEIRDGVGIDRDTEAAKEQIKYNFEVLEPGQDTHFGFRIELENGENSDFALLGMLLEELKSGRLLVGGKKARGFGQVKLNPDYKVQYFDAARKYPLSEFLQTGRWKETTGREFESSVIQPVMKSYFA